MLSRFVHFGFVTFIFGNWIAAEAEVWTPGNHVQNGHQRIPWIYDYVDDAEFSSPLFARSSKELDGSSLKGNDLFTRQHFRDYHGDLEYDDDGEYDDEGSESDEDEDHEKDPVVIDKKFDKFEKIDRLVDKIHNKIYDKYLHIKTKTPPEPPDWAKEPVPSLELPPWHRYI